MSLIFSTYEQKCNSASDINEHLRTIYNYAKLCKIVAEYGVREVTSTYALAAARPDKIIFVDIIKHPNVDSFLQQCKDENINAVFYKADTLKYELQEPVDLLFIDTLHSYNQLKKELEQNYQKVNKYIILHDTVTFGYENEVAAGNSIPSGLVPAINEFITAHPEWKKVEVFDNNNGLTVLGKQ